MTERGVSFCIGGGVVTIKDCISQIISSSGNIFETDQERVIASILQSENVMFLDTCFITKSSHIEKEGLFDEKKI